VVLVGCASTRPACPAVPAPVPGPAFLWRADRSGGPPLWLFGTIHDAGIEVVPKVALDALDASPRFASELGTTEVDPEVRRELSFYRSGTGIDQSLGDDWYDLRDKLRDRIKEAQLARARPWFALILLNNEGAPKTVSMDEQLGDRAAGKAKPVDNLETFEVQMRVLDSIVTVEDLRASLRAHGRLSCDFQALIATYAAGDLAGIAPMLVIPRTAEPLLFARNRAWLPALEKLATTGAFVAVGLGHMLGEQGLPALLTNAGYTVTRVEK
ncbi:MAG: TraB/GumN family protein, partial [Kofleriaceae bacterium]